MINKSLLLASFLCVTGFTSSVAQQQQPQAQQQPNAVKMQIQVTCTKSEDFLAGNEQWGEDPMFMGTAGVSSLEANGEARTVVTPMMILTNLDTGTYTFVLLFGENGEVVCPLTGGSKFSTIPFSAAKPKKKGILAAS